MSLHDFAEFIRHLSLFTAVRESRLMYPILLSTHLSCIAVFGGLILVTNLRLLGIALTNYSIASVVRQLRPWKWAGLLLMLSVGILLAGSKANIYVDNPYFVMKISTLLLIVVHFFAFRCSVYRDETVAAEKGPRSSGVAKVAGALSLALWVSIVVLGRWIAYYDRPDEAQMRPQTIYTVAGTSAGQELRVGWGVITGFRMQMRTDTAR
jgi:hypothetical protein